MKTSAHYIIDVPNTKYLEVADLERMSVSSRCSTLEQERWEEYIELDEYYQRLFELESFAIDVGVEVSMDLSDQMRIRSEADFRFNVLLNSYCNNTSRHAIVQFFADASVV